MSGKLKIKAVLFDLDGTLLDTLPDLHAATNAMLLDMGQPELPLESVRSYVGRGIPNLIKRAMDAQIQAQYGTCRQLYTKGLGALANVTDKDPYLLAREEDMRQGMRQLEEHLQQHSEKELQNIKDKEADELDVLFQPKKKW